LPSGTYPRTSVAVLPFANLTGSPDLEYMGDGIATQLISTLGKVPSLTVPSRTSSFSYRGQQVDAKRIARELGVGTILEGSVLSAGEELRLTLTLVDASTDRQFWTESFRKSFKEFHELHEEVSHAIVAALTGEDTPLAAGITGLSTENPEAFRLFLEASGSFPLKDAIKRLDRAISLDPDFAMAYALRASMRLTLVLQGAAPPPMISLVEADANRALEFGDQPTARAALATAQTFRGQWLEADRNFRKAMELAPLDPMPRSSYIDLVLDSAGYLDRALPLSREAVRLAPSNIGTRISLATQLTLLGRTAEAEQATAMALDLARIAGIPETVIPLPQLRADHLARAGRFAEAAQLLKTSIQPAMRSAGAESLIDEIFAARADPSKAPAALRSIDSFVQRVGMKSIDNVLGKDLLNMQVFLGGVDQAYRFANSMVDEFAQDGVIGMAWAGIWVPDMAPFRRDPRFHAFASRLNLPEIWRVHGPPDGCSFVAERIECQ
jgi:TolB-like protein